MEYEKRTETEARRRRTKRARRKDEIEGVEAQKMKTDE